MRKVIANLALFSILLHSQHAFACTNEIAKKYISKAAYYMPKHFCKGKTKFLKIDINTKENTENETFGSIGLLIKDANGEIITSYAMSKSSSKKDLWFSACIAESYAKTTDIEFIVTHKKEVFSDKTGTLSRSLTVKSESKSCNLHDFLAGAQ